MRAGIFFRPIPDAAPVPDSAAAAGESAALHSRRTARPTWLEPEGRPQREVPSGKVVPRSAATRYGTMRIKETAPTGAGWGRLFIGWPAGGRSIR